MSDASGTEPSEIAEPGAHAEASAQPPVAAQPVEVVPELADTIERPAKVLRIGSMTKQLLEEVRQAPLDAASRVRLKEIYETSIRELADGLSPDLAGELDRLALPFESAIPSDAELRVAQAQLVGWLEGLFHGIQATLFAQQMAAQSQLQDMRQRGLPPATNRGDDDRRVGSYL